MAGDEHPCGIPRTRSLTLRDEDRFQTLVEALPAMVYIVSHERNPVSLYVSPPAKEISGYTPEEWAADPELGWKLLHPDDRARMELEWANAREGEESISIEYRIFHRDGRLVWLKDVANLVRADDGTPLYWQGIAFDVTDRKRAEGVLRASEEQLRESEARYRTLVEQIPAVVYRMGPDDVRHTLYVSQHVEQVLGYTRHEWLDQPDIWVELLHPDDREIELAAHDRLTETGEAWIREYRLIASDGRTVWIRDQAVLTRDGTDGAVWQGVMLDITEQKDLERQLREANDSLELRVLERTIELEDANEMMSLEIDERRRIEAELRETRERYRHLVEDLPAVVYLWQVGQHDPFLGYTSPQVERLLGYTSAEWNDPTLWVSRLHQHDRDRVLEASRRSAETGEPFEMEHRYFSRDGRIVWVLSHATLLERDEAGRPLLFQGVLLDITARKEAEAKAREVEQRYRELAENVPAIVATYDVDPDEPMPTRVIHVSPLFDELMGSGSTSALTADPASWPQFVHPDDLGFAGEEVKRHWITGEPWQATVRLRSPENRTVWTLVTSSCVARGEDGRPQRFQTVLVDVTPEMEELDRLRRAEEMLRTFVEGIPGVPWLEVVDGEPGSGRLVYIGPQVEAQLGYTAEELVAEPNHFDRMVHPDDRERIVALSALHDRTEEPFSAEYRAIRRDGRVVWLRCQARASRDDRGRLIWRGVTDDITAEREGSDVAAPQVVWVPNAPEASALRREDP